MMGLRLKPNLSDYKAHALLIMLNCVCIPTRSNRFLSRTYININSLERLILIIHLIPAKQPIG